MHRPFSLSAAAPGFPVSRLARFRFPGLRRRWEIRVSSSLAHPSALLSTKFQVAPHLRLLPRFPMSRRVAPIASSSDFAGDRASSFLASRLLRRCLLESSRSPRHFVRPRLAMSLRVAPNSASSGFSGDGDSSILASRILQRCWRSASGLPRILLSQPRLPDEAPGCPESCIFRPCRR